jgi:hypothetical protein
VVFVADLTVLVLCGFMLLYIIQSVALFYLVLYFSSKPSRRLAYVWMARLSVPLVTCMMGRQFSGWGRGNRGIALVLHLVTSRKF